MSQDQPSNEESRRDSELDATFEAMMAEISLPEDVQAGLASLDAAQAEEEAVAEEPQGAAPTRVSPADVPHNTYGQPTKPEEDSDEAQDDDGLDSQQRAEIDSLREALSSDAAESSSPRAVKVAVVLTPIPSASALAALCSMAGLDCTVVPARSGAFVAKEFVSSHEQWDVSELLGGDDSEPAEAAELASSLSRLSRAGVVLLTADLATDVGIESGLSGTITARRYVSGEPGDDASAGLLLSAVDQVVEDVLIGAVRAEEVPGALRSTEVKPGRAARWLGKGLRRPRPDTGD